MSAGSLQKSSKKLDGKPVQPSGQVVAAHLIPYDSQSLRELALVSLVTIQALQRNMFSSDARSLSYHKAMLDCVELGIPESRVLELLDKISKFGQVAREADPISSMF